MLTLYAHPFSSYCWKVLIALWENERTFAYARLDDPAHGQTLAKLWPFAKMPLLVDDAETVPEASIIIEHLQLRHGGPVTLIPEDPIQALDVRRLDRLSDNYLMAPMQAIVADQLRPEGERDAIGVARSHAALDTALGWWNDHIAREAAAGRDWAWEHFSLADCAAAPALFYIDWIHPFAETHPALHAYRARLLARPSIARAVDEARPFRHFFPFGDPGRD
jgi:glutathione S-transferase